MSPPSDLAFQVYERSPDGAHARVDEIFQGGSLQRSCFIFNIALQMPTPPVKVTDKVRDHFGIEISDGVKNK